MHAPLTARCSAGFFLISRNPLDFHQRHIIQVVWELAVGLQFVHSRNEAHGAPPQATRVCTAARAPGFRTQGPVCPR